MCSILAVLTKPAGDVILSALVSRFHKNLRSRRKFDQLAEIHVSRMLRYAGCLLHVVGNDDDGVVAAQLADQLFNARRRDWIQRGRGSSSRSTSGRTAMPRADALALLLATDSEDRSGSACL